MSSLSSLNSDSAFDVSPGLGAVASVAVLAAVAWEAYASYLSLKKPLYPVQGIVLCDGQPAEGAHVTFHPLDEEPSWTTPPSAYAAADGSFSLSLLGVRRGAPAGNYAVTVEWQPREVQGESFQPGRNVLPAEYAQPKKTPLRAEVLPHENQLPAWTLPLSNCSR